MELIYDVVFVLGHRGSVLLFMECALIVLQLPENVLPGDL